MTFKGLLQGAVLCTVLLSVFAEEGVSAHTTRRRRCRCKKYMEKINRDIDKRLKVFEDKFENYFTHPNDMMSTSNSSYVKTPESSVKLDALVNDMNATRETLRRESYSLRLLQESLYSQDATIDNINSNFKKLDGIVKNLSAVVEKLESTIRNNNDVNSLPNDGTSDVLSPSLDLKHMVLDAGVQRHPPASATKSSPEKYPTDCEEVYRSGGMRFLGDYYIMVKPEKSKYPFKCLCKIADNSGWTVIQRRKDGSENFSRDWDDYKHGFGNLQGEFWLGNDRIHWLTTQQDTKLRIEMEEWSGEKYWAEYDRFRVGSETGNYRLRIGGYHGTAGDSLTPYWRSHDGKSFSTRDRDNDDRFYDNCAEHYEGAWWFNDCFESHLNGKYYQNGFHNNYFVRNGIQWNSIHSYSSLKSVEMMIKPADPGKLPNDI